MDFNEIKELIQILGESEIAEFQLEVEGTKLMIRKGQPLGNVVTTSVSAVPQLTAVSATAIANEETDVKKAETQIAPPPVEKSDQLITITAPMVGTFYRAPAPDAEPFVQVGSIVEPGQTVCIIEAMKLMNEIEADHKGRITEILVDNGEAVEFGQPLFVLEKQ